MSIVINRAEGNSFTRSVSVRFEPGEHVYTVTKMIGYGSRAKPREETYELVTAKVSTSARAEGGTIHPGDWEVRVSISGRRILKSGDPSDTVKIISEYDLGGTFAGTNLPEKNREVLEAFRELLRTLAREHASRPTISIIEEEA